MKERHFYLLLCLIGLLFPYSQFVPWIVEHGLNLQLFVHDLFVNRISGFFGLDVIVSALVLWLFVWSEGRRLRMRYLWLPVLASLTVGVSLGLPLFLYLRQSYLEQNS
jgi:hypothetical protein